MLEHGSQVISDYTPVNQRVTAETLTTNLSVRNPSNFVKPVINEFGETTNAYVTCFRVILYD